MPTQIIDGDVWLAPAHGATIDGDVFIGWPTIDGDVWLQEATPPIPPDNPDVSLPTQIPFTAIPCKVAIACPGTDSPVINVSSEMPDTLTFTGWAYTPFNPYQPPPLFPPPDPNNPVLPALFVALNCTGTAVSAFTQEEADLMAAQQAYLCQQQPQPPSVPLSNSAQTATVTCPSGAQYSFTTPANLFFAATQASADASALAFAQERAAEMLAFCSTPPDPGSTFTNVPTTAVGTCSDGTQYFFTTPAGLFFGITQADADTQAFNYAQQVVLQLVTLCENQPPRPPPGQMFFNTEQSATTTCPDGTENTYTVPAGLFAAKSQDAADQAALAYAKQQVSKQQVCINITNFPDPNTSNAWACLNRPLPPAYTTYSITGIYAQLRWIFSISSGHLPTGVRLVQIRTNAAQLVGTPSATGHYNWKVKAVLSPFGPFQSSPKTTFSRKDSTYVIGITNATVATPTIGDPYSDSVVASGGVPPYTYAAISALPTGLTMASNGHITGTCTGGLVPSFECKVTDSDGRYCAQTIEFQNSVVTPDILSNAVSLFSSGQDIPYGNYRIRYKQGALLLNVTQPNQWWVNWRTRLSPSPIGYKVNYNGGTSTVWFPATDVNFPTQAAAEAANHDAFVDIVHSGGTIGVWLDDNPYGDNGPGHPSPTFQLTKLP